MICISFSSMGSFIYHSENFIKSAVVFQRIHKNSFMNLVQATYNNSIHFFSPRIIPGITTKNAYEKFLQQIHHRFFVFNFSRKFQILQIISLSFSTHFLEFSPTFCFAFPSYLRTCCTINTYKIG